MKRTCETCGYFSKADFADIGWCLHPHRRQYSGDMILVRKSEIACRDGWGRDLWHSPLDSGPSYATPNVLSHSRHLRRNGAASDTIELQSGQSDHFLQEPLTALQFVAKHFSWLAQSSQSTFEAEIAFDGDDSAQGADRAQRPRKELSSPVNEAGIEYDVAISFAGTERSMAQQLAVAVQNAGFRVFFDDFFPERLWGEDLAEYFDGVFRERSRYCVIFKSREYIDRMWTIHERRSAVSRMLAEKGKAYILPIQIDPVDLPGVPPTIGYLSIADHAIAEIAEILVRKLELSARSGFDDITDRAPNQQLGGGTLATSSPFQVASRDQELFEEQFAEALRRADDFSRLSDDPNRGFFQVASWPGRFIPDRYSPTLLKEGSTAIQVVYRDWPFLWIGAMVADFGETYRISDGIESRAIDDDSFSYSYWQLRASGFLFHRSHIPDNRHAAIEGTPRQVPISEIVLYVAEAIDSIGRLYRELGERERITIRFDLLGTLDRQLSAGTRYIRGPYRARIPSIRIQRTQSLHDWMLDRNDLSREISIEILRNFNWEHPNFPQSDIEALFAKKRT